MKSDVTNAINSAVISGFAQMAFIDVENLKNACADFEYTTVVGVDIIAPVKGKLYFYFSKQLKELLIKNIYDENLEELAMTKADDCQLELANIIAGDFLSQLHDCGHDYQIGLPSIYFDENSIELPKKNFIIRHFDAEGAKFKIFLHCMKKDCAY